MARLSHEALLKKFELLVELDSSIHGWIAKLQQVENRRNLVQQKLLEHVAAATIVPLASGNPTSFF